MRGIQLSVPQALPKTEKGVLMFKVDMTYRLVGRAIAGVAMSLLLASCADSGFQFPWSKKPETGQTEATVTPPKPQPASKQEIKKIQAGLARLGYRPGPADGMPGKKTKRAIQQYQRKNGMPETGDTTVALLAHIEAALEKSRIKATPEKSPETPMASGLPQPSYLRGTEYVYQNGIIDRVEGVRKGEVKWRRSNGIYVISAPNFLLPRKYWETAKQRGKAIVTSGDKAVWPKRKNQTAEFVTIKTVMERARESDMKSVEEKWRCSNEGEVQLSVVAGTFDTIKLVCTQVTAGQKKPPRRIWHYAPALRHYVRLDEYTSDNPTASRWELVAIRPGALKWPPVARAALEKRLIHALNTTPVGGATDWKSSGISTDVTVTIESEYFDPMGRQCRRYLQSWKRRGEVRYYPGVACHDKAGEWRLPVMTETSHAALAVASRKGR